MTVPSSTDPAVAALPALLAAAGYSPERVGDVLGVPGPPYPSRSNVPVHLRRLPAGRPLSTLIKLFLLSVPVAAKEATRALGPLALDRLRGLGFLGRTGQRVRARVRLVPYRGLILACDPLPDGHPRADWVDGVTLPTDLLATLTVRRPIAAALDVATGSGVQALLAARHARRVVATDINPRAVAFAALNARLNRLPNVECRQGSLFAPVADEQFDLIVCNPPYVISPDSAWLYRDSGKAADTFCRDLVRRAPRFLKEGGFAHILCNWVHRPDEDWWAPVRHWLAAPGFDAWLLRHRSLDPLAYASAWNVSLARTRPGDYEKTLDRWLAYYRHHRIGAIASGAIVLRGRAAARNWIRADDFPNEVVTPAGDQIVRTFAAQDYLATIADDRALLRRPFRLVAAHRLERAIGDGTRAAATRGAVLQLDEALAFRAGVDAMTVRLLERCDGRRPLGTLLDDLARVTGRPARRLRASLLPAVRQLVRLGFLVPPTG